MYNIPISSVTLEERFDIFRSYFHWMVDGIFIGYHSVGIDESKLHILVRIETEVERIINGAETFNVDIYTAWGSLWHTFHNPYKTSSVPYINQKKINKLKEEI